MHSSTRLKTLDLVTLFVLLLTVTGCAQMGGAASDPLVTVDTGELLGTRAEGVQSFRGIPYAAAPTGALRWRPTSACAKRAPYTPMTSPV